MDVKCFICGESNGHALQDHHKIPRRYEGSDKDENIVTLCANCHQAVEKIYNDRFWRRLGVYQTWDLGPAQARYKLWAARTLVKQLENWMESRRFYLERHCDYHDIEHADPHEVETKEQAFQLGRYQAWASVRDKLLHGQSDEMALGEDVLDYHPDEQRGTAEWR